MSNPGALETSHNSTEYISQNFRSSKEVSEQFLVASPHRSFFPPKLISRLMHKHKPKRSVPKPHMAEFYKITYLNVDTPIASFMVIYIRKEKR